jgi:phage/plasmid-associated DNA primase
MGDNYNLEAVNKFMCDVYKKYDRETKELITDLQLVEYHKRLFGYCLSGDIGDRSLHINVGVGCNSKSSIINIFSKIIDKFYCTLPPNILVKKSSSTLTPELEILKDARLALMPESERGDEVNCGFIKSFTGGDKINCRPLFRKNIMFYSPAKGMINTQFLPKIPNDKAMWDRIKPVNYLAVFENTLENTAYIKRLQTDYLSDFFTYFCYGAQEYFKSGFNKCDSMNDALEELKGTTNTFLCFIKDTYKYIQKEEYNLLKDTEKTVWRIPRADIYTTFNTWCGNENNKDYKTITRNEFYAEIRKFVGEIKHTGVECFTCQYKQQPTINDNNTAIIF